MLQRNECLQELSLEARTSSSTIFVFRTIREILVTKMGLPIVDIDSLIVVACDKFEVVDNLRQSA